MAVEIRELVIKAVITQDDGEEDSSFLQSETSADKDLIIQECINQVLKIIRKSKTR